MYPYHLDWLSSLSIIMLARIFILTFLAVLQTSVAQATQVPLPSSLKSQSDSFRSNAYKFKWPIHKIAVIGAGQG